MLKMTITNQREIDHFFRGFERAVKRGINRGFRDAGVVMKRTIFASIKQPPKTGRIYHRRGRRHQASAPRQPPANDRGRLASSIKVRISGSSLMQIGSILQEVYPRVLENGGGRIKARPYLKPGVLGNMGEAETLIGTHIVREIRRSI